MNTRCAVVACAVFASVSNADVLFSDSTFTDSTWAFETFLFGAGGGFATAQQQNHGNPAPARRNKHVLGEQGENGVLGFNRYGTNTATRYDPMTEGAIASVDFSIEFSWVGGDGAGQTLYPALKQGAVVFISTSGSTMTGASTTWTPHKVSGLDAPSFVRATGGSGNPDFSANGAPIRFGFATRLDGVGPSFEAVDFDNFSILVRQVPSPGTLVLLAPLAIRRRR